MAAEGRGLYRVPVSFRRVLLLVYLLAGNPSSATVSVKEHSSAMEELNDGVGTVDWSMLLLSSETLQEMQNQHMTVPGVPINGKAEAILKRLIPISKKTVEQQVNKLKRWADAFAQKRPEIHRFYEKLSGLIENLEKMIKENPRAISYFLKLALWGSVIAIFCESYALSQNISEHIQNVTILVKEFDELCESKIKPWMEHVSEELDQNSERMSAKNVKRWKRELESITKSVDEILEKVLSEALNNVRYENKSNYLGFTGLGTIAAAGATAFKFRRTEVSMAVLCTTAGVLVSIPTVISFWNYSSLQEKKKEINELIDKIYERRKEIKTIITRLDILLMDLEGN